MWVTSNEGTGGSYIGSAHEEAAQMEFKNFWLARGDKKVVPDAPYTIPDPKDGHTETVQNASYHDKYARITQAFSLSFIAIVPKQVTTKEVYISSSLSDTLQHLSDSGESLLFKMNAGVLLICPVSFLGDSGVTTTMPLTTIRALKGALQKSSTTKPSIIDYARMTASLDDDQMTVNAMEYGSFVLVAKWRLFLRTFIKNPLFCERLNAGNSVVMDKSMCIAFNTATAKNYPNAKPVTAGDVLRMRESSEDTFSLPKPYPPDFLKNRTVIFSVTKSDGEKTATLRDNYFTVSPKYAPAAYAFPAP